MKSDTDALEKTLRRHLGLFGSPSSNQLEASRGRIRERLRADHGAAASDAPRKTHASGSRYGWRAGLSLAAAAAIIVLFVVAPWRVDLLATVTSWSRHAEAILAVFTKGMADTSGTLAPSPPAPSAPAAPDAPGALNAQDDRTATAAAPREFEEASVRRCDPDNLPQTPAGARGGGANSLQMTPGRLNVLCATVATLIRVAYGYSPMELDFNRQGGRAIGMEIGNVYGIGDEDGRRVRGGPEWVRSERYTIEAVAGGGAASNAEMMRGAMLQRLLERRLQLKAHVEAEQVPAFALSVTKGGLKIKPVTPGACEPLPGRPGQPLLYGYPANVLTPPHTLAEVRRGAKPSCGMWGHRNGPNQVFLAGDVPLEALTSLGFMLGGVRVIDKTGVPNRFNIMFEYVLDENTPGPRVPGAILPPGPAALVDVPRAATIFTALEEQLGLKLEPVRAPREFVVIDRVERPSPN